MERTGTAVWIKTLKEGNGIVSTESGTLDEVPYSFATRFENAKGTNPEELIAAAHAACFSMALSGQLGKSGLTAESIETVARLKLEKDKNGFSITGIHLVTHANVPTASREAFHKAAEEAKAGCPVSRLLRVPITMEAILEEAGESLSA